MLDFSMQCYVSFVMDAAVETGYQPYAIRIRGDIGERIMFAFPDFNVDAESDDTVLRGTLPDQAALHGVELGRSDLPTSYGSGGSWGRAVPVSLSTMPVHRCAKN